VQTSRHEQLLDFYIRPAVQRGVYEFECELIRRWNALPENPTPYQAWPVPVPTFEEWKSERA